MIVTSFLHICEGHKRSPTLLVCPLRTLDLPLLHLFLDYMQQNSIPAYVPPPSSHLLGHNDMLLKMHKCYIYIEMAPGLSHNNYLPIHALQSSYFHHDWGAVAHRNQIRVKAKRRFIAITLEITDFSWIRWAYSGEQLLRNQDTINWRKMEYTRDGCSLRACLRLIHKYVQVEHNTTFKGTLFTYQDVGGIATCSLALLIHVMNDWSFLYNFWCRFYSRPCKAFLWLLPTCLQGNDHIRAAWLYKYRKTFAWDCY